MSVIPVGAVLEMARTGTFACCASGSAALAVFESVGPRMALTRSRLMNFWKTVMPCSLVDASSSISTLSFGPPPPVTCSTPAWMPARCKAPYEAAAPVRLSAAPIVAPPPDAGASEPWSLHAAARSSNRESDHRRARLMGSPSRRGMLRYRKRRGFARLAGCARLEECRSLEGVAHGARAATVPLSGVRVSTAADGIAAQPRRRRESAHPAHLLYLEAEGREARQGQRFALRVPTGKGAARSLLHPTGERSTSADERSAGGLHFRRGGIADEQARARVRYEVLGVDRESAEVEHRFAGFEERVGHHRTEWISRMPQGDGREQTLPLAPQQRSQGLVEARHRRAFRTMTCAGATPVVAHRRAPRRAGPCPGQRASLGAIGPPSCRPPAHAPRRGGKLRRRRSRRSPPGSRRARPRSPYGGGDRAAPPPSRGADGSSTGASSPRGAGCRRRGISRGGSACPPRSASRRAPISRLRGRPRPASFLPRHPEACNAARRGSPPASRAPRAIRRRSGGIPARAARRSARAGRYPARSSAP